MNLNTTHQKVMFVMYTHYARTSEDEAHLLTYDFLWTEMGDYTKPTIKRAVRQLIRAGMVEHSPAVTEDGVPNGSGFMLTELGEQYAKELDEVKKFYE